MRSRRRPAIIVGHSFGAGAATELVMRYPDRARGLVLVDAALGLTAAPSDPPAVLRPKWVREILVSLTITNPLATKLLLQSLIAKKERALPEYVEILQRPTSLAQQHLRYRRLGLLFRRRRSRALPARTVPPMRG